MPLAALQDCELAFEATRAREPENTTERKVTRGRTSNLDSSWILRQIPAGGQPRPIPIKAPLRFNVLTNTLRNRRGIEPNGMAQPSLFDGNRRCLWPLRHTRNEAPNSGIANSARLVGSGTPV